MASARVQLLIIGILVVAVVAAGLLLISDQRSPTHGNKCTPGEASPATLLGTLTVPAGGTAGNLTLTLENSTCSSITAVTITASQPGISGIVNSTFIEYYGTPISVSNPLPVGQNAIGQLHVEGLATGQQYKLTLRVTLSSGEPAQTLTMILVSKA
jgi:hypothetical protein